jgi:hypothetical protein
MPAHYNKHDDTWTVTHDVYTNLSVTGPKRSGCEERLAELASRYRNILLQQPLPDQEEA